MFIDSRALTNNTVVHTDICIVGAGAAGITLARELAGAGKNISLLESGGINLDLETQALYEGTNVGWPYWPLESSRIRFLGGTTNHWGGACIPLNEDDFEQREWVPGSGWPLTKTELLPYYHRAQPAFDLGEFIYRPEDWVLEDNDVWTLDSSSIVSRISQLCGPTRFGQRYRKELEDSSNIDTYLFANAVNIDSDPMGAQVTRIECECLTGNKFTVMAGVYIIALGGIENARLLLVSDKVLKAGLGNQHDLVGRYFSDHPWFSNIGKIVLTDPKIDLGLYLGNHEVNGTRINVSLELSPKTRQSARLLTSRIHIQEAGWRVYPTDAGKPRKQQDISDKITSKIHWLVNSISKQDTSVSHTPQKYGYPENARLFRIGAWTEVIPRPESRVYLSEERDRLGLRKPILDWKVGEEEKNSLIGTLRLLGQKVGANSAGRIKLDLDEESPWPWAVGYEPGLHHMGTTRMSDNPLNGVVDKDCKVHGMSNLYIAGSSVFPTYGTANPTLTIVALAIRLADRIKANSS